MAATPDTHIIQKPLKSLTGLLLALATLAISEPARAQVSTPSPQVLSRNQQSQNYTILHVDAANGSERGTGEATKPYKTVTQALQVARPGVSTVILLAPGHYSQASGESFPLRLRPGITIQGNTGEARNTIIVGSGQVQNNGSTHSATIVTADRSGLANVAISNPKGDGVWITAGSPIVRRVVFVSNRGAGIHVSQSAPIIENSYFNLNAQGLVVEGSSQAIVRGNYFEATGRAISVSSPATPTINNNRIARNDVGIALKNNARPTLEANVLDGNRRNGVVEVDSVAIAPTTAPNNLQTVRTTEVTGISPEVSLAPRETIAISRPAPVPETALAVEPNIGPSRRAMATELSLAPAPVPITGTPETQAIAPDETTTNRAFSAVPAARPLSIKAPPLQQDRIEESSHTQEDNQSEAVVTVETPLDRASTAATGSIEEFSNQPLFSTTPHQNPADLTSENQVVAINSDEAIDPEAIPIAVIPVDGDAMISAAPTANEKQEGLSKLLARLNDGELEPAVEVTTTDYPEIIPISTTSTPSQRLPVPAVAIPSGQGTQRLAPPGTRSLARAFRYRILVEMDNANHLKTLVPDAFRTRVGNRTFMQAGAYVDEAEAQERLDWLEDNGIQASINVRN
ncbi:MAG: DUF1565 domain-containing protein [Cyanobacteria bacterium J06642_11]